MIRGVGKGGKVSNPLPLKNPNRLIYNNNNQEKIACRYYKQQELLLS